MQMSCWAKKKMPRGKKLKLGSAFAVRRGLMLRLLLLLKLSLLNASLVHSCLCRLVLLSAAISQDQQLVHMPGPSPSHILSV